MHVALQRRVDELLSAQDERNLKLSSLLVVRFDASGKQPGARVLDALDTVFAAIGGPPQWSFGFFPKAGSKTQRVAKPKDVTTPTGNAFLRKSLAALTSAGGATVLMHDGSRPHGGKDEWLREGEFFLVPERFGVYLHVEEDGWNSEPSGTLLVAFPIDQLAEPRYIELGDLLVKKLAATVAWLTPGLWGVPSTLQNSSFNELPVEAYEKIAAELPQLDVPLLYFGNSEIDPRRFEPKSGRAFVAPHWVTWLGTARDLVEADPPFGMNEVSHARYVARRKALREQGALFTDDRNVVMLRLLFDRFSEPTYAATKKKLLALRSTEKKRRLDEEALCKRAIALSTERPLEALRLITAAYVEPEAAVAGTPLLDAALHAARMAADLGVLTKKDAEPWLRRMDDRRKGMTAELDALAISYALDDEDRARAHAKSAIEIAQGYVPYRDALEADPVVKKVKADPRYASLWPRK